MACTASRGPESLHPEAPGARPVSKGGGHIEGAPSGLCGAERDEQKRPWVSSPANPREPAEGPHGAMEKGSKPSNFFQGIGTVGSDGSLPGTQVHHFPRDHHLLFINGKKRGEKKRVELLQGTE